LKSRICANKKGIAIEDTVPIIIFILAAAIAIFLFNFIQNTKITKSADNIQIQKDRIDGNEALLEYLKKVDENGNSKADFISKNYNEKNYDAIRRDLEAYFRLKFSNVQMWRIELYDSYGNNILRPPLRISDRSFADTELHISQVASMTIPINSPASSILMFKIYIGRLPR